MFYETISSVKSFSIYTREHWECKSMLDHSNKLKRLPMKAGEKHNKLSDIITGIKHTCLGKLYICNAGLIVLKRNQI